MRIILSLFLFVSFFSFSQEEKRLALVIGNSNYDSIAKLANPVNDALKSISKYQNLSEEKLWSLEVYVADGYINKKLEEIEKLISENCELIQ